MAALVRLRRGAGAGRARGLLDTRPAAAQVDLPAHRPHLVGRALGGRRHDRRVDRVPRGRSRRAGAAARIVACRRARRGAGGAAPARRALGRARQRPPHAPPARTWFRRAVDRLPRFRPQQHRIAIRGRGGRGRARRLALAWRAAAARAPLRLRPLAGRCDRRQDGRRARRCRRADGRRQLHVDSGRRAHDGLGLAAGGPADHAALRRRREHPCGEGAGARRARRRGPADPARARPRALRTGTAAKALRARRRRQPPQHDGHRHAAVPAGAGRAVRAGKRADRSRAATGHRAGHREHLLRAAQRRFFASASSRSRSSLRCTLPVVVIGSSATNSISFGYS